RCHRDLWTHGIFGGPAHAGNWHTHGAGGHKPGRIADDFVAGRENVGDRWDPGTRAGTAAAQSFRRHILPASRAGTWVVFHCPGGNPCGCNAGNLCAGSARRACGSHERLATKLIAKQPLVLSHWPLAFGLLRRAVKFGPDLLLRDILMVRISFPVQMYLKKILTRI